MTAGKRTSRAAQWRFGLIGCGRFGRFCLERVRGWERARFVAATDQAAAAAEAAAREFGLAACATPQELFARADVDLVLISTPPTTHHPLTLQALQAGKHVVCEKPLALTVEQADEMVGAAHAAGRLLAVNHMLRYNPLLEVAERIIRGRVLGEPLHFLFENYAEDERLPADHWFWDERQSGGIFIEHAVHFFDLYRWWLGAAEVLAAHVERRPGTGQVDRAWCSLRHQGGALGQQYHGFDQPSRLDRAEHRLLFERGDLTVLGWIPMELQVHGIVDRQQQDQLAEMCRGGKLQVIERYDGQQQSCRGRGKDYRVTARIRLERRLEEDKAAVYGRMIRSLFGDQLLSLEHPDHEPRLQAEDAREAVRMAADATGMSQPSGGDDDSAG